MSSLQALVESGPVASSSRMHIADRDQGKDEAPRTELPLVHRHPALAHRAPDEFDLNTAWGVHFSWLRRMHLRQRLHRQAANED